MTVPIRPDMTRVSVRPSTTMSGLGVTRISRLFGRSKTIQSAAKFLSRHLWAWPVIAAVVLGLVGVWVHFSVEEAMQQQRRAELNTIIDTEATAIRVWMAEQRINAILLAADAGVPDLVEELAAVRPANGNDAGQEKAENLSRALLDARAQRGLRARLDDRVKACGYYGFYVISPEGVVLASDVDIVVGLAVREARKEFFDEVLAGTPAVSKPFRSKLLLPDQNGELRANLPTMMTAAAVRSKRGKPIGVLALRFRPEDNFTKILRVAEPGRSGETYAFDRGGVFLSQSRFDEDLKSIGLLADLPGLQSILTLEVRDPGVNLVTGNRPPVRRAQQPLTRMAAFAVAGTDGVDVDGYRDYRGVPVVGAWRWLPDCDFGIATEIEVSEAFRPAYLLRRTFLALMGLLGLAAVALFAAMWFIARQHRLVQEATLAAKHLGQYTLEEKLGAGGMGTVFKARHALLRRPTAIKLLNLDKASEAARARFEREVQQTSRLTHPNTLAIFDYGRTPDDIFYYVMEYLDGENLDDLVRRHGALPEARAVHILRQVCGSLAEAHAAGLVHRDIKPANIFVTTRGGMRDFVKVLDFGLVKALEPEDGETHLTSDNAITGTPLYISPEGVSSPALVDARSDVYAIGAVGYFLLTGTPVFRSTSIMELCMSHVNTRPESPSARLNREITGELEALICRCLAKSPADRPGDAGALLRELERCPFRGTWTSADADAWWAAVVAAGKTPDRHAGDAGDAGVPPPTLCAADPPSPESSWAGQNHPAKGPADSNITLDPTVQLPPGSPGPIVAPLKTAPAPTPSGGSSAHDANLTAAFEPPEPT